MDAPVPLILVVLLAAVALVAPSPRGRAFAMLVALAIAPVILVFHIADSDQFRALVDRPALAAAAAGAGVVVIAALAALVRRRPAALPILAVAALPFRVPIAVGGTTANLLVPLYAVVAAGVLAYALPRAFGPAGEEPERRAGPLEWVLAAYLALYAAQSWYSVDFDHALENVVFFYVPFALLFALVSRVEWTPGLTKACLGVVIALALVFAGVGFVEYATRHLFLNPKVIASNQLQDYFRVNSLFFDPNIYGRFLALVMLLVVAWVLWARRARDVAAGVLVLAVLWGGLVLTLSQSSFAALLVGLAVLGGKRWSARRAVALAGVAVAVGVAVVLLAPGALRLDLGSSRSADAATSGRYELVAGGVRLFAERPLQGWGSGAFARQYRRAERVSAERATSASHTIPITVAAEQGVPGLLVYLALLGCALWRLFRRASRTPARAGVAAAFAALLGHTILYAAFLEDPMAWTLLAVGTALAVAKARTAEVEAPSEPERAAPDPAPAPTPA
ncbi:MAG TPA: O-antigen ligase family protein [Solirubrobacteraceae bacterium]|nr:O-antigen ligase family protein [Solirubrobacteraceae bacterium]